MTQISQIYTDVLENFLLHLCFLCKSVSYFERSLKSANIVSYFQVGTVDVLTALFVPILFQ